MKQVYNWDYHLNITGRVKTWSSEVQNILNENDCGNIFVAQQQFNAKDIIDKLKVSMTLKQKEEIKEECRQKPKLRTFINFKNFDAVSPHIGKSLTFVERKIVSQLRLGVLPLRLETARFLRPLVPETERVCFCGSGNVENEVHFLFHCSSYIDLRINWLKKLNLPENFQNLENYEKLNLVLNISENIKPTSKYLVAAMDLRRLINKSY